MKKIAPIAFALAFSAAAQTTPAAAQKQEPTDEFLIGVGTHFAQGKGDLAANLNLILQAGATTIRDEVGWAGVEKEKGRYAVPERSDAFVDRAIYAGLDPLLALDYGNQLYGGDKPLSPEAIEGFTRYAEFVVKHFKGKVKLYEIWNEWDGAVGGTKPGTAEAYVNLLKAVYPRIKKIDPAITVLGGGMTSGGIRRGWMENMLKAGALTSLDAVSIHTYNQSEPGRGHTPEAWADFTLNAETAIRKYAGGKEIPLYVTETGWPNQLNARGTAPTMTAAYLARMYLLARTIPSLKGIWWYDFQDDGWQSGESENNFGLVRPDLTPKPPFYAMADISKIVPLAQYLGRLETSDPDIRVLKFGGPDGKQALAIWTEHEDDDWQVTLHTGSADPQPVSIREVGREPIQREWGRPGKPKELSLTVRQNPWLVIGNMEGVTVTGVTRREFAESTRPVRK
jgi:hypothetical protein